MENLTLPLKMLKVQSISKITVIRNSSQCVIQEEQYAWHRFFEIGMFYMEMEIIMQIWNFSALYL